jgi:hypothetical protein
MSSLKTFIAALRTGETRTTQALDKVVARRRGAKAVACIQLAHKRGAFNTPLQGVLREAVGSAPLAERFIQQCIDGWPDAQKEQMRKVLVAAITDGRRVRFAWGLTPADGFKTEITDTGSGAVTITALTPRSSLRAHPDGNIDVMPGKSPTPRPAAARRGK